METAFIDIVDKKKLWEKFLLEVSSQSLFQSWSWGEVEKRLGKKVWRVGVFQEAQGSRLHQACLPVRQGFYGQARLPAQGKNLLGISQVVKVEAKRGTFFHVRHGPVFREWSKEIVEGWLKWVRELAREERAAFIRVSPLIDVQQAYPLRELGFWEAPIHHSVDALIAWVLDLDKSKNELLLKMRKTTRYLIRKGEKMGVKVIRNKNLNNIYYFIDLYKKTCQRQGFVSHQGIKEEYEIFKKEDQADLFLAQYQGKILAGALIIYYNNQAIYHHGASIKSPVPASYLLQWEAIKEAKRREMRYYNFWGIADTQKRNHSWWGLTLFKKGFGGGKVEYLHTQDWPLSPWYALTFLVEKTRKWLKGY